MIDRSSREYLLDVSRLIWRLWEGKLPTGIDRVCLEYLRQFGSRSFAVLQFRGRIWVLSAKDSDRLFALLLRGSAGLRHRLAALLASSWLGASRSPPRAGMLYLNVGHTGLDDRALPAWISANSVRAVYMIHDLIPLTHPQFCRPGEADRHAVRLENAFASAAGFVVNSQATLDELAAFARTRHLPMPETLIAWISGYRITEAKAPPSFARPYFVAVGTIEARKNHLLLLKVWKRLVDQLGEEAPILLIIGQRGWEAEAAHAILDRSAELKGRVRELAACSDEELAGCLSGARALLMPSFVEGFGLPVVEALQLGTPVIATDLPVYREVVGDIPTYLAADDPAAWARTIREFIADTPERERQKRAAKDYRPPDWPSHFELVERWVRELEQRGADAAETDA